jgi:hypothetical protein
MTTPWITLEPDPDIEPGHQWIVIPDSENGWALMTLLGCDHQPTIKRGNEILIAHDQQVDRAIVQLINQLAHVRFSAPDLVQLMLAEPLA